MFQSFKIFLLSLLCCYAGLGGWLFAKINIRHSFIAPVSPAASVCFWRSQMQWHKINYLNNALKTWTTVLLLLMSNFLFAQHKSNALIEKVIVGSSLTVMKYRQKKILSQN